MTTTEVFVARENVARMRSQLEGTADAATQAMLRRLLVEKLKKLREAEAGDVLSETDCTDAVLSGSAR